MRSQLAERYSGVRMKCWRLEMWRHGPDETCSCAASPMPWEVQIVAIADTENVKKVPRLTFEKEWKV